MIDEDDAQDEMDDEADGEALPSDPQPARIEGLLARAAPVAVLFRRGPSKSVGLFRWDLRDDRIEEGQWFWGRIYTRRCDLSPDGSLLCYFAAKFKRPLYSWTAISRPPYLTALALWPKGDAWGGGGLFETQRRFGLNHHFGADGGRSLSKPLLEGLRLPRRFEVTPLHEGAGGGEDEPIESMRLVRDGWTWKKVPSTRTESRENPLWISYDPPLVRTKPIGDTPGGRSLVLRVLLHGLNEKNGRWYAESADIRTRRGDLVRDLGRIDWADVDASGDVLWTEAGRVHRLARSAIEREGEPRLVADLDGHRFRAVISPEEMRRWP